MLTHAILAIALHLRFMCKNNGVTRHAFHLQVRLLLESINKVINHDTCHFLRLDNRVQVQLAQPSFVTFQWVVWKA